MATNAPVVKARSLAEETRTSRRNWSARYSPCGRPKCAALARTAKGRTPNAGRKARENGPRPSGAIAQDADCLGQLPVVHAPYAQLVEKRQGARIDERLELLLAVLVVHVVDRGIEVARVAGELVDPRVQLVAQDLLEGFVAHAIRVRHPVLPLTIEAALEDDWRLVAQVDPVLLGQLQEARVAGRAPVHVLVGVQVRGLGVHAI